MLRLEPVTLENLEFTLDHVMTWINDPEVVKNLANFNHAYTKEEEREFYKKMITSNNDRLFNIIDNGYVGQIGIHQIYWPARHGRSSTIITKQHQHQGHSTKALSLLLNTAFDELQLNKMWAKVFAENPVTNKMLQSMGYSRAGVLRDEYVTLENGEKKYHDMNLYELRANDWRKLKAEGYYEL